MNIISDILTYPFMQRALIASVVVGILCSYAGCFVVMRRMAFFSDAIAHAAFAGIAAGMLLDIDFSISSVAVAILIAFLIAYLSEKTTLSNDTAIGIGFSAAIASGMLIIGMLDGYRGDLFGFLFGDILTISNNDLLLLSAVGVIVLSTLVIFMKPLLQIAFNKDIARVEGTKVRFFEYLLFFVIALVVTVSLKIVGIILVTSLLIVPAASAKNLATNMRQLFGLSITFGVISGIAGLMASVHFNSPSGPTIVLVSIGIFFLTLLKRKS
ncbi:MAG: metal ABC transporter permease [Nitrospirae bacterium]|nr:metal ABC transporter permease [Nitrospirota bacterium]